jgi:hypothetical protein
MSSSNDCCICLTAEASGTKGFNIEGASAITFDATGILQLIASCIGMADISVDANGSMIAVLWGAGSSSITVTATLTPGAIGFITADAVIELTATMVSYGIGWMSGTTADPYMKAIADAVWKHIVEGALSAEEILRILLAVQAGKSTINLTPPVTIRFRDQADTKNRVVGEMSDSERVNVTLDGSL